MSYEVPTLSNMSLTSMNTSSPAGTGISHGQTDSTEVGLLNKSSRLAAALGVAKFMTVIAMN